MAKRIAAKWIRRFRWSQLRGPLVVSSTGGLKNGEGGGAGCAVQTVANAGSKLSIFVVLRAMARPATG
jgi:hypothetical protein